MQNNIKFSIQSFHQFIKAEANKLFSEGYMHGANVFEIFGSIEELGLPRGQMYYAVKLADEQGAYVPMDVPKYLIDNNHILGGEYVRVIATIYSKYDAFTQGYIKPTLDVSHIEILDSPTVIDTKRKDQASLKALQSLNPHRRAFPFKSSIRISVLRSKQSQVIEDFTGQLKELDNITFDEIGVSMTDAAELTSAIKKCDGDVIAIIRGGGDPDGFDCFNSIALLTAINEHKAYRVLGIGHSLDVTLADCVCDYSASTPTAAGLHIKEMLTEYANLISGEKQTLETQKQLLAQQNKLLLSTAENLRVEAAALLQKNQAQTIQINAMSLEKNIHFSKFNQRLEADTAELRQRNRTQAKWIRRLIGLSLVFALYFVVLKIWK